VRQTTQLSNGLKQRHPRNVSERVRTVTKSAACTPLSTHMKGAYGAAIGTILGTTVLLGKLAIGDWLTGLIAVVSRAVLFRFEISNPPLIGTAAVIGLVAFPLLRPSWAVVQ